MDVHGVRALRGRLCAKRRIALEIIHRFCSAPVIAADNDIRERAAIVPVVFRFLRFTVTGNNDWIFLVIRKVKREIIERRLIHGKRDFKIAFFFIPQAFPEIRLAGQTESNGVLPGIRYLKARTLIN